MSKYDFLNDKDRAQAIARLQHHPRIKRLVTTKSRYKCIKARALAKRARRAMKAGG